jgi:hypothetical protein
VFDGRQVTATLAAIHQSLHTGETVPVPQLGSSGIVENRS